MPTHPSTIQFTLPAWIDSHVGAYRESTNLDDRMSFVIEASKINIDEKTGGPFAAAVFEIETGKLIALGVNLVMTEGLSMLHAEMVAISLAQKILGAYDMGQDKNYELISSSEPCAMCFGAIPWSGVKRLVVGAREADVRAIGFDEGAKVVEWKKELEQRDIEVVADIQRNQATQVLKDYSEQNGCIYNV